MRIRRGQVIGDEGCPFLKRWTIEANSGWSLRFHHFYPDHVEDVAHSHPWWFLTVVLKGGYKDISCYQDIEREYDYLHAGSIRFRSRNHTHKTKTGPNGAWTIVLTGARNRTWGFWQDGKFIPYFKWISRRAPCE